MKKNYYIPKIIRSLLSLICLLKILSRGIFMIPALQLIIFVLTVIDVIKEIYNKGNKEYTYEFT